MNLVINNEIVMSDNKQVVGQIASEINNFWGDCLIAGLGIGHSSRCLLLNSNVKSVTVVEINQVLIDRFSLSGTNVICADIFDYVKKTDKHYDNAYLCIWHNVTGETYKEIRELKELVNIPNEDIVADIPSIEADIEKEIATSVELKDVVFDDQDELFECLTCGIQYKTKKGLENHQLSKHREN